MEIFTPTEAARNAGTKYRSILVAARFARYLNEFPKDRQVQWAENERVMKLTTLSMRKLVSGELNFPELRRRRSEGPRGEGGGEGAGQERDPPLHAEPGRGVPQLPRAPAPAFRGLARCGPAA